MDKHAPLLQIELLPTNILTTQINLCGEFNFDTVTDAYAELVPIIQRGTVDSIHLEGVHTSNSAGLAFLLSLLKIAKQSGKAFTFKHIPPALSQIAKVTGASSLIFTDN